jgi:hypothetical protein
MAFSLGAFARGFAQAAVTDRKETEDRINELVDTAYKDKLLTAKELRKENKAKREKLRGLANQYKLLGIEDEAQIAGLIAIGPEAAAQNYQLLLDTAKVYREQGKAFDVNAFVKGTGVEGLTIEEGINRVIGTTKPADQNFVMDLPGTQDPRNKLLFGDPRAIAQARIAEQEQAFGESFADLTAETGEREFGDTGDVTLDIGAMFLEDRDRDIQRQTLEASLAQIIAQTKASDAQAKKLKAEVDQLKGFGPVNLSETRTLTTAISKELGADISNEAGSTVDWDPETGEYKEVAQARNDFREVRQKAAEITNSVISLMQGTYTDTNGDVVPAMPYNKALQYAKDNIIPNIQFTFRKPQTIDPPDPQAVVSQTGQTSDGKFVVGQVDKDLVNEEGLTKKRYNARKKAIINKLKEAGASQQQILQALSDAGIQ